ncbi:MAG: SpoIIE family protein phosphatase [Acidimicrobiia bacterium]
MRRRLGYQVAAGSLIAVVVFAGAGGQLAWNLYQKEDQARREAVAAHASDAAQALNGFLNGELATLSAIAASPVVVAGDVEQMFAFFERADPAGVAAGAGLGWVDRSGWLRVLVSGRSYLPIDLSNRDYVQTVLQTGQPYVSNVTLSTGDIPFVTVAAPTFDPGGVQNGVLIRSRNVSVANVFDELVDSWDDVHVLDRQGNLVVDHGPVPAGLTPAPSDVVAAARDGRSTVALQSGRRVVSTAPIDAAGWTVLVDPPWSAVLGDVHRQWVLSMTGVAVTALCAFLGLGLLSRRTQQQSNLVAALALAGARAESLQRIATRLSAALTPAEVSDVVREEVRISTGADAVTVGVVDTARQSIVWLAMAGYSDRFRDAYSALPLDSRSAAAEAVRSARPIVIQDRGDYLELYPEFREAAMAEDAEASGKWPLIVAGKCLGVLGLMWKSPHRLDASERRHIETIASLVARSVVRSTAYASERDLAEALQQAVMPTLPPQIDGLQIAGRYLPDSEGTVGGDWYDVMLVAQNSALLVVGDVVGHGIPAAQDMVQLRNAIRTLAIEGHEPDRILAEMDQVVRAATSSRYATAIVAIVALDRRELSYSVAGHPPPMVRHGNGAVSVLRGSGGPPLGIVNQRLARAVQRVELAPDDCVVLYTDGLIENRHASYDESLNVLTDVLATTNADDLEAWCDDIIERCAEHTGPQLDDICVLVVRC